MTLDVLDVVQLGSERVGDVDDDDLPVGLALIKEGHDTENLDLFDLTGIPDLLADLANIERIVVALGLGFRVGVVGVLPGLERSDYLGKSSDEREGRDKPEGRHRSSKCNHDGGSSCERNANDPFLCLV